MSKLAFLGAGNMASAMVDGLLAGEVEPGDLICYSASGTTAKRLAARTGIAQAGTIADLLAEADGMVVAFKPQHLKQIDPQLTTLTAGKLVISVLLGKRLTTLAKTFPHARNIVRTMPNTPGRIGAGITAWCSLHPLNLADRTALEAILGALGSHMEVDESQMDAITAVSGSGPGFIFEFAGAMRDAGVAAGLDPATAKTLVVETLLGSARLLARSGEDPEILRNQVTSPNGSTFAGLQRLEAGQLRQVLRETILAAKARAEEISQDT